jgi:hypothetical protein
MLETIRIMEERLNRCRAAADALETALEGFESVQDALAALESWYGSEDWLRCLAADERGELPSDLRRGVLSQDAIYDLLADADALRKRVFNGEWKMEDGE